MTITMAMTTAKTGRSMKNFAMRSASLLAVGLRVDQRAGTRPLQSLDDHAVAGLEALLNDPALSRALAGDDAARLHFIFRPYRHHGLHALHLLNGAQRNQDDVFLFVVVDPYAAKLAGQQVALRIGKRRLHFESAGLGVHLVDRVCEVARVGVSGSVSQN